MIVDFQLLNEDMLTIGKARLDLQTEDIQAVKLGLMATGHAYTQCRCVKYSIFWQDHGPQTEHGEIHIEPCQEDS